MLVARARKILTTWQVPWWGSHGPNAIVRLNDALCELVGDEDSTVPGGQRCRLNETVSRVHD